MWQSIIVLGSYPNASSMRETSEHLVVATPTNTAQTSRHRGMAVDVEKNKVPRIPRVEEVSSQCREEVDSAFLILTRAG